MRQLLVLVWMLVACGDNRGRPDAAPPSGLDERPHNATCKAPPRPPFISGGDLTFAKAFPNLEGEFSTIGLMRSRIGASGPVRWFMVDRRGRVYTFTSANASRSGLAADGVTPVEQIEQFVVLTEALSPGAEGGLLGAALDPEFGLRDDANFIYVHYTTVADTNKVVRFRVARQRDAWAIVEQQIIFETISGGGNHWGGDLKFGPDGYLYISLGDGGGGFDPTMAQKPSWLRGKILRIDPRGHAGYVIPPGNPYATEAKCGGLDYAALLARTAPCPEIFASGFRNPYRISFDRETSKLWVGDVGATKEEIDQVVIGKNYGWTVCDGILPTTGCPPAIANTGFTAPVAVFREGTPVSVTGGYVYRGTALGLAGAYIFAEVYTGRIHIIDEPYKYLDAQGNPSTVYEHPETTDPLAAALPRFRIVPGLTVPYLVSFAEDEFGELYAITLANDVGGAVLKLVPTTAQPADTIPERLSLTGCVDPAHPSEPAPGMIPYEINAPFWSDGADKARFLAIPDGTKISVAADGDFTLPEDSVVMKHFRLHGKLVETRLFVRHTDGTWAGYTYVWREDGSDADRANPIGETRLREGQLWRYPSRAGCMSCHSVEAGFTLGLESRQLDRVAHYASTNRDANQLATLAHIGMFETPPPALEAFAEPSGSADVATRARVYLHTNCAPCHRGSDRYPNLFYDTPSADRHLCDAVPLVVPGSPEASPLHQILVDPDVTRRMPQGGGNLIDAEGAALVADWIRGATSCP